MQQNGWQQNRALVVGLVEYYSVLANIYEKYPSVPKGSAFSHFAYKKTYSNLEDTNYSSCVQQTSFKHYSLKNNSNKCRHNGSVWPFLYILYVINHLFLRHI